MTRDRINEGKYFNWLKRWVKNKSKVNYYTFLRIMLKFGTIVGIFVCIVIMVGGFSKGFSKCEHGLHKEAIGPILSSFGAILFLIFNFVNQRNEFNRKLHKYRCERTDLVQEAIENDWTPSP